MANLGSLPPDLPAPVDDDAAAHLTGMELPTGVLLATNGQEISLRTVPGILVLFVYPMIGNPEIPLPAGWSEIPGARGCTVQAISYSESAEDFARLNATVFGVSLQSSEAQVEARQRLGLQHQLLSDSDGSFYRALRLPVLMAEGRPYLRRLTMGVISHRIERVWYPVFPPGSEVDSVLAWLSGNALTRSDTEPEGPS